MNPNRHEADHKQRQLVIGLAGGIASGKSLVADILTDLGAKVVDSDELVQQELFDPEVIRTYRDWWGARVISPTGDIDRKAVADVIFADPVQRRRMEGFLYPRLERRRERMMSEIAHDPNVRAVVINSPLLYEVGLDRICDVVVFVESDRDLRLERVAKTRGWSATELDRRENLQNPLDIKRAAADHTVVNNSGVSTLRSQVEDLFERMLADRSRDRGFDE